MSSNTKCFFVYEPETKNFIKIDFAYFPHQNSPSIDLHEPKHERKLTREDEPETTDTLGTMEFEPITILPA